MSANKIFSRIKYKVVGDISNEVKLLLEQNGAEKYICFSDFVTHCIVGSDPCEDEVSEAIELYNIPTVAEEWVMYSWKCKKLLPISAFNRGCNRIFNGVVASCTNLSDNDIKKMWAMLIYYGGRFSSGPSGKIHLNDLRDSITHLIVGKAEGPLYLQALESPDNVTVVTPDWVIDSIRAGRLLETDPYHPRLLLEGSPDPESLTEQSSEQNTPSELKKTF